MVTAGCSASHEAYDVAVTWQCNQQRADTWNLVADSLEMASGVARDANEANHQIAQYTIGENCAFTHYSVRTRPT